MARIRSIKPEYYTSVTVARVSINAAFMFPGLWTHCDDHGRAVDDARLIKAALFPLRDEITAAHVEQYLSELERERLIVRYKVDGRNYLAVPESSWIEHQKIDRKKDSKLPKAPEHVATRRRRSSDATSTQQRSIDVGKERKGAGKGTGSRKGDGKEANSEPSADLSIDDAMVAKQTAELLAAALPHEAMAFHALMAGQANPDQLVLELHATAMALHIVRGPKTGKTADIADVMRAIAEMAALGKEFSVPLFRGFLRRVADRPPEPPSTEERQLAKLQADIAKRAAQDPTRGERNSDGVIVPIAIVTDDSEEARQARAKARTEAMARFRAEAGRKASPDATEDAA